MGTTKSSYDDIRKSGIGGVRGSDLYDDEPESFAQKMRRRRAKAAQLNYQAAHGHIGYEELQNPAFYENRIDPPDTELGKLGESRFDTFIENPIAGDVQNQRAYNQPWWSQALDGTLKAFTTAGTTFVDGTVGLLNGLVQAIYNVSTGSGTFGQGFFDNATSNAMRQFTNYMEEILPNYRSQDEIENPWALRNIFSVNTIFDDFVKNLGFTVGAFYSGDAWLSALRAAGAAGKMGQVGSQLLGSVLSGFNEGRIEAGHVYDDMMKVEMNNLKTKYKELYDEIDSRPDTMVEVAEGQYVSSKKLAMEQLQQNLLKEQNDIKQRAAAAASVDMVLNSIYLPMDNLYTFGKLYGRGFKIKADLANRIKKTGEKEFGFFAKSGLRRGLGIGAVEGFEEINQRMMSEFGTRYYSPDSPDEYYRALVNKDHQVQTKDFMQALTESFQSSYGDPNGWKEFAIGALTGLIGMPTFGKANNSANNTYLGNGKFIGLSGGLVGSMKEARILNDEASSLVDQMNEAIQSKMNNQSQFFTRAKGYQDSMDGFSEENNEFEYNNAADNSMFNLIDVFGRAGQLDFLKQQMGIQFDNVADSDLQSILESTSDDKNEWANADGTPMSSTEEGRQKMRAKLNENKKAILDAVDDYEKSLEITRGIGMGALDDDQTRELAWYDWKMRQFEKRFMSIKDNNTDEETPYNKIRNKIQSLLDAVSAFNRGRGQGMLSSDEEGNKIKQDMTIVEAYLRSLLSSDSIYQVSAMLAGNKGILDYIEHMTYPMVDDMVGMSEQEFEKLRHDLSDMAKIAIAAGQFQKRYNEFTKHPEELIQNRKKIDEEENKRQEVKQNDQQVNTLRGMSVNELANVEGLQGMLQQMEGSQFSQEDKDKLSQAAKVQRDMSILMDNANQILKGMLDSGQITQQQYDAMKNDVGQILQYAQKHFETPNDAFNTQTEAYMRAFEDDMGMMSDEDQDRLDNATQILNQALKNSEQQRAAAMSGLFSEDVQRMVDQQEQQDQGSKGGDTHMSQSELDKIEQMQKEVEKRERQEKEDKAFVNSLNLSGVAQHLFGTMGQQTVDWQEKQMETNVLNLAKDLRKLYYDKSLEGKSAEERIKYVLNNLRNLQLYNDLLASIFNNNATWLNPKIENFLKSFEQGVAEQDEAKKFERSDDNPVTVYITDTNEESSSEPFNNAVLHVNTTQFAIHPDKRKFPDQKVPYWQVELDNNGGVETTAVKVHRAIHQFLTSHQAFDNVRNLRFGNNPTVIIFGMSKALNDQISDITGQKSYVVLLLDEDGNVYGDLVSPFDKNAFDNNNRNGELEKIYADVSKEYEEEIARNPQADIVKTSAKTKVWQPMNGRVIYNYNAQGNDVRISLNEWNPGFKMALVVNKSNPQMHDGTSVLGQTQVRYPKVMRVGKPYVLIEGAAGQKIPVSIGMYRLDYDSQKNTHLVQALQYNIANAITGAISPLDAKINVLDLLALQGFYVKVLTNDDNQKTVEFQIKGNDNKWHKVCNVTLLNKDAQGQPRTVEQKNTEAMQHAAQVIKEIQRATGGVTFQISKMYINKTYDKLPQTVDYNTMIGELATINLPKGFTKTVNDWFTLQSYVNKKTPVLFSHWQLRPKQHEFKAEINGAEIDVIVDTTTPTYAMYDKATNKRIDLDENNVEYRWAQQIKARLQLSDMGITLNGQPRQVYTTNWGKYDLAKDKFVDDNESVVTFKQAFVPRAPQEVDDRHVIITRGSNPLNGETLGFAKAFPSEDRLGVSTADATTHWISNGNYIIFVKVQSRDGNITYDTIAINRQTTDFDKLRTLTGYLVTTPQEQIDTRKVLELYDQDMNVQPPGQGGQQGGNNSGRYNSMQELEEAFMKAHFNEDAARRKWEASDDFTKDTLMKLFNMGRDLIVGHLIQNLIFTRDYKKANEEMKRKKINKHIEFADLVVNKDGTITDNGILGNDGKQMKATKKARIKMNARREMRWMSRALPQLQENDKVVLVNSLQELSKKADGARVFGLFKNGIIYLFTESIQGVAYHESFHYVFDTLLSQSEKNMAYNEARQRYGDLSSVQLEEKMAESFRKYTLWEQAPVIGALARLWHKLKRFVNSLFGKEVYLNRLFYEINNGKYAQVEQQQQEEPQYDEVTPQSIRQYHVQKNSWMALESEDREFLNDKDIDQQTWSQTPEDVKDNILYCK